MTQFQLSIFIIHTYIAICNAQYFNCTGDYTSSTQSPCYKQIMNCYMGRFCTIECGDAACHNATINGGNENVYVNCSGCLGVAINGGNGDIYVNCYSYEACYDMRINGGNGDVYVNCNGEGSWYKIHINAKTANLLRVN
eukprot:298404_1